MITLILMLLSSTSHAQVPSWAQDATKLDAKYFQTACSGTGPSTDLARAAALEECKGSAAHELSKSFTTTTLSVQTESSVGYHQEIANTQRFDNLTCEPQKEEIKELPGQFEVWVLCKFSVDKLKVVDTSEIKPIVIKNPTVHGADRTVVIASVPKCQSVLVLGGKSRMVPCKGNPTMLVVSPEDTQILVRADGYLPKKVDLTQEKSDETIQIFLDRN